MDYARTVTDVPQSMPASPKQVKNSAGGYSFKLDEWDRLDRFLILGTEGGTYYIGEQKLTLENATNIRKLIAKDGLRVVRRVVEISESGRAHKNDPALFVLALASIEGDVNTRRAAFESLHRVARIPTFLFTFLDYRQTLGGGWGRSMRESVSSWYTNSPLDKLAYHVVKYRQRGGWTHRDVLRKAHPVTEYEDRNALFKWLTHPGAVAPQDLPRIVQGYILAQDVADDEKAIVRLIADYGLPREAIPTQFLKSALVWDALLQDMPMTAMIRNLVNMTKCGLLKTGSAATKLVVERLHDEEHLRKSRVHPLGVLLALKTYADGSVRGGGYWLTRDHDPVSSVIDALDDAFYASFKNVEPTGKRILLGLDVSGSMSSMIPGTSITCAEGTAVMAMATARVEQDYDIRGFCHQFVDLGITAKDSLRSAMTKTLRNNFGGTDCSLPMNWALKNRNQYDAFVVYTDSETWAGRSHPHMALRAYRKALDIPAKMVVVGMAANKFTIADPDDAGMLDVVGFDASAPAAIADFIRD